MPVASYLTLALVSLSSDTGACPAVGLGPVPGLSCGVRGMPGLSCRVVGVPAWRPGLTCAFVDVPASGAGFTCGVRSVPVQGTPGLTCGFVGAPTCCPGFTSAAATGMPASGGVGLTRGAEGVPACRCFCRRQSWQREESKMLGWNLGQMRSSPDSGMVHPEGARAAHTSQPSPHTSGGREDR